MFLCDRDKTRRSKASPTRMPPRINCAAIQDDQPLSSWRTRPHEWPGIHNITMREETTRVSSRRYRQDSDGLDLEKGGCDEEETGPKSSPKVGITSHICTSCSFTSSSSASSLDQDSTNKSISDKEPHNEHVSSEDEISVQPNFAVYRDHLFIGRVRQPEPLAEYLATTVAVFLSLCGNLSYHLNPAFGTFETLCWTNGLSTTIGIYTAGGVSGAHLSPVITLVLVLYRGFPWRKGCLYVLAQLLASLTAGGLAYAIYHDAIHHTDPDLTGVTVGAFYSTPRGYISHWTAFWNEFVATAILICVVFALGDEKNVPPSPGMFALVIGFVITILTLALGYNTGPTLNPVRDMATRVVALMTGYGSKTFDGLWWWIGGCWGANITGGLVGGAMYDLFILSGKESPVTCFCRSKWHIKRRAKGVGHWLVRTWKRKRSR